MPQKPRRRARRPLLRPSKPREACQARTEALRRRKARLEGMEEIIVMNLRKGRFSHELR